MLEEEQIETASVFERIVAFLIDFILFFSAWFWSYYLILQKSIFIPDWQASAYYWFFIIFFLIYCAFFNAGGRQTLGKFLLGVQVVDKNTDTPISLGRAFWRSLAYYLNLLTFTAGFLMAFITKDNRALQDFVVNTKVIRVREKSPAETMIISALGVICILITFGYIYYSVFVFPVKSDQIKITAAKEQLDDIAILQDVHYHHFGKYTPDPVRLGLISGDAVRFQRDMQNNLKRRGFSMAVGKDGYTINGIAKDSKLTPVTLTYINK